VTNDPASSWAAANLKRNLRAQAHLAGQLHVEDPQPRKQRQKIPKACHYCGKQALTRDHIVPKAYLDQWWPKRRTRPQMNNLVPACTLCNVIKADYRSDCRCKMCMAAWAIVHESDAPPPVQVMPVMLIAQFRNGFWTGETMDKLTMFEGHLDQLTTDRKTGKQELVATDEYGRRWTVTLEFPQPDQDIEFGPPPRGGEIELRPSGYPRTTVKIEGEMTL
jgi:hypothetical protein